MAVNAGDNNAVELNPVTHQTTTVNLDPADPPSGALFGLAVTEHAAYYVNDDNNLFVLIGFSFVWAKRR